MTTDARRLMRLRAVAQGSNRAFRLHSNKAKWFGGRIFLSTAPRVNPQAKSQGWPYEGLSRMKGNFHVRFLEGGGLATARLHSTKELKGAWSELRGAGFYKHGAPSGALAVCWWANWRKKT